MNFLRSIIAVIALSCCALSALANELRCTVTINSDQIQGSNKEMFNTLQQSIEEYVTGQVIPICGGLQI